MGYRLRQPGWVSIDPAPDAPPGGNGAGQGREPRHRPADRCGPGTPGATVLLTVRDKERGMRAREEITATLPDADVRVEICDVSDLASVRTLAADLAGCPLLDVLVHNAGVLPPSPTETAEGHETTLATHILGPVLLTDFLLPVLAESPDPR